MSKYKYQNTKFYVSKKSINTVKESDKVLLSLVKKNHKLRKKVLDVGCATGNLLKLLSYECPNWELTGVDSSRELIETADKRNIKANFYKLNFLSKTNRLKKKYFDIVFSCGTLGIFDEKDAKKFIENIIYYTKPGGEIFLLAPINSFYIDTLVTHRSYQGKKPKIWEKGFNIYSKKTIKDWILPYSKKIKFIDFEMPFDLQMQNDVTRSWTFKNDDGKRLLTNGLGILIDLKIIRIIL